MIDASQELVRALLETVHDAIIVADERGRIEMANERAERLFGYGPRDLIGKRIDDLVPTSVRDVHRRYMASYLAAPRPRAMGEGLDVRALRADGTEVPVEIALTTFRVPSGLRVSATIRERAASPRMRTIATDPADEASVDASRRLAQIIGHDFNNQLGVIFNATSLLLADLPEGSPLREDVESIRIAAERASAITRSLHVYARDEPARVEEVEISELVRSSAERLSTSLPAGITIAVNDQPGLWRARGDTAHLHEAIAALVENAVEAMPAGGVVTIAAANTTLDESVARLTGGLPVGPYVCVSVHDTGVGMTAEVSQRAFEPFFTSKRGIDGAGLGLPRVHSTAREAGGAALLYSEVGVGTIVRLYLQAVQAVAARPATPPGGPLGAGETVLLVEDELTLRALTRLVLRRGGYLVLDAASGDEALEILSRRSETIDLLLTDLGMPGMSGRELARRARALRPDLRVLYTSGYPTDVLVGRGQIDPGVALVEKPYTEDRLLHLVRSTLGTRA